MIIVVDVGIVVVLTNVSMGNGNIFVLVVEEYCSRQFVIVHIVVVKFLNSNT